MTGFDWWVATSQYQRLLHLPFKDGVFLGQGLDDMCVGLFLPQALLRKLDCLMRISSLVTMKTMTINVVFS